MPPKNYITFVWKEIEITIGVYSSRKDAEEAALAVLCKTVQNPLDYRIKTK